MCLDDLQLFHSRQNGAFQQVSSKVSVLLDWLRMLNVHHRQFPGMRTKSRRNGALDLVILGIVSWNWSLQRFPKVGQVSTELWQPQRVNGGDSLHVDLLGADQLAVHTVFGLDSKEIGRGMDEHPLGSFQRHVVVHVSCFQVRQNASEADCFWWEPSRWSFATWSMSPAAIICRMRISLRDCFSEESKRINKKKTQPTWVLVGGFALSMSAIFTEGSMPSMMFFNCHRSEWISVMVFGKSTSASVLFFICNSNKRRCSTLWWRNLSCENFSVAPEYSNAPIAFKIASKSELSSRNAAWTLRWLAATFFFRSFSFCTSCVTKKNENLKPNQVQVVVFKPIDQMHCWMSRHRFLRLGCQTSISRMDLGHSVPTRSK